MKKKLTRKDMKVTEDEYFYTVNRLIEFIQTHRNTIIQVVVIVGVIVLIIIGYMMYRSNMNNNALIQEMKGIQSYDEALNLVFQNRQNTFDEKLKEQFTSKFQRAVKEFETVINDYPGTIVIPDTLLYLANSYYHLQKFEKAKETFQKIVKEYPRDEHVMAAMLGIAYCDEELKQYENAISGFETIMSRTTNPQMKIDAQLGIARNKELLGQKVEAVAVYKRLIDEYPPSYYGIDQAMGRLDILLKEQG